MRIEPGQRHILWVQLFLAVSLLAAAGNVASQTDVTVTPGNAHASRFKSGWECSRGFLRVERACVAIKVPANAYLNSYGDGWNCNRRYLKVNEGCRPVVVPDNAHEENERFGAGWQCNRGYRAA